MRYLRHLHKWKKMISEIYIIIKKNLTRLVRSKLSALIILLGPLFMILLIGIAFDKSNLYGVKIGVYAQKYDNITSTIILNIEDMDFKVIEEKDENKCINDVKDGKIHLCIVLAEDENLQKKIKFYVDYSRLNLVYTLLNSISAGLSRQSTEISMGITEDLLLSIKESSDSIKDNSKQMEKFRADMAALGIKITQIEEKVTQLNVSMDFNKVNITRMKDDINESKSETAIAGDNVDQKIDDYKEKLDTLEKKVDTLDGELAKNQEEIDDVKSNVKEVYDELMCTSKENLFINTSSSAIAARIKESDNPECAILNSMLVTVDDRTKIVYEAKSDLKDVQYDITQAKEDLNDAESSVESITQNSDSRFNSAENTIVEIEKSMHLADQKVKETNELKRLLQSELSSINTGLNASSGDVLRLKKMLDNLTAGMDSVSIVSPESVVKPITTEIKPIMKNKSMLDYLFPSLIILIITFTSILLASTIIMKEKSSPAYFRNFITPTSNLLFVIGSYLTALLVVFCQSIIIFIVGYFVFGIELGTNIGLILLAFIPIASIFIFIGMILGYLFKSEETTTLASISISCVLFLFSSAIVPIENMSSGIGNVAKISPFVLSEIVLRQLIIFQSDFSPVVHEVFFLIFYLIILFCIVVIARIISRHYIEQ
jgi:ABC-type multidrug transport system permease subunit